MTILNTLFNIIVFTVGTHSTFVHPTSVEQDFSLSTSVIGKKWKTYYQTIEGIALLPYHPEAIKILIISENKLTFADYQGKVLVESAYQYNNDSRTITYSQNGETRTITIESVSKSSLKTKEQDEFGEKFGMVYRISK